MDINNGIVRDFREISALIPPRPRKQWLVVGVWNSEFVGRKYVIEMCERSSTIRIPLCDRMGEECMVFFVLHDNRCFFVHIISAFFILGR